MASRGITDKVAVVGMGCTRFGERWDSSTEDLILEAFGECIDATPNVAKSDIDAYWLGTLGSGQSGLTLSRALSTDDKPVTRVENYCATGSEAFRNACYGVASGAYDVVMAVGVEKLKDSGFSGSDAQRSARRRHVAGVVDDCAGGLLAAGSGLLRQARRASRRDARGHDSRGLEEP